MKPEAEFIYETLTSFVGRNFENNFTKQHHLIMSLVNKKDDSCLNDEFPHMILSGELIVNENSSISGKNGVRESLSAFNTFGAGV